MLTIEFKAKLTKQQEELVESWLPGLRNIWNVGLRALEEFLSIPDRYFGLLSLQKFRIVFAIHFSRFSQRNLHPSTSIIAQKRKNI